MTGEQLTLDELCDLGAEQLHDPIDPRWRDLRRQRLTADQWHRIVDIEITGEWL
jgi:hypothetical protein